jgi:hypothetical protein
MQPRASRSCQTAAAAQKREQKYKSIWATHKSIVKIGNFGWEERKIRGQSVKRSILTTFGATKAQKRLKRG